MLTMQGIGCDRRAERVHKKEESWAHSKFYQRIRVPWEWRQDERTGPCKQAAPKLRMRLGPMQGLVVLSGNGGKVGGPLLAACHGAGEETARIVRADRARV